MNENESNADRISGEQGSVKPEETLTDIFRQVAYARSDGERGAMRAAANGALLNWLAQFHTSDVEDDQEILEFALKQNGFDSFDEFTDAFLGSGEAAMSFRMNLEDLDPEELEISDSAEFELRDAGDDSA